MQTEGVTQRGLRLAVTTAPMKGTFGVAWWAWEEGGWTALTQWSGPDDPETREHAVRAICEVVERWLDGFWAAPIAQATLGHELPFPR